MRQKYTNNCERRIRVSELQQQLKTESLVLEMQLLKEEMEMERLFESIRFLARRDHFDIKEVVVDPQSTTGILIEMCQQNIKILTREYEKALVLEKKQSQLPQPQSPSHDLTGSDSIGDLFANTLGLAPAPRA